MGGEGKDRTVMRRGGGGEGKDWMEKEGKEKGKGREGREEGRRNEEREGRDTEGTEIGGEVCVMVFGGDGRPCICVMFAT
jgi:hypothetical protein